MEARKNLAPDAPADTRPAPDPSLTAGETELVRACLAPAGGRLATAAQVADRIAALRA